ncbi:MAG TPA: hypothetical protein VMU37_08215 [Caulobacteraceae bacterium]|nr:hypothetical protein [Caulobacteraceae bacterium]
MGTTFAKTAAPLLAAFITLSGHFASVAAFGGESLAVPAQNEHAWEAWDHKLASICPKRHVDWLYIDAYPDLYGAFNATLSENERRRVDLVASTTRNCATETMGFSCELANHLRAYQRLGLLDAFTAFSCRKVRCEEAALCSRAPGQ